MVRVLNLIHSCIDWNLFLPQANLWIIIFSYVGNYFWTHYFFKVLGASYTFPSWKMNNVSKTNLLDAVYFSFPWAHGRFFCLTGASHNIFPNTCLLPLLPCCIEHHSSKATTFHCWFTSFSEMVFWGCMDTGAFLFHCILGDYCYCKCMLWCLHFFDSSYKNYSVGTLLRALSNSINSSYSLLRGFVYFLNHSRILFGN